MKDIFKWEVPNNVELQYESENSNYGSAIVSNQSLRRQESKIRQDLNENDDDKESVKLRYIGGVDISATKPGHYEYDKACAGIMIFEYPSMELVHQETEIVTLEHPYIAGFLAFREVSHLIKLIKKVKKEKPEFMPQLIMVKGNGILHYRRMGLATHLAMEVKIPTVE